MKSCFPVLTSVAAIELNSHSYKAVPLFGIKPDIATMEAGIETIEDHSVPVIIASEHLKTR